MKKNFQKLWMLALLMVFGTVSSWAYTADLSMSYELAGYKAKAFYDFTGNADGVLPTEGDLRFRSGGYGLYNFGSGNRSGNVAIAVNESDLIVCQFADTQNRSVTINSISGCTKSTTLDDGSHIFFTADSELSTLTFNVGRAGCVVSVLIMEVDNTVATADYTLNYICDGNTVKTVNATVAVGATVLTDASFFANNVKYFRANGQPESFVIAAGDNIFNVNVRLAEIYDYTLLNNLGETITTGSGFEGETVTVGYPRYALADGKFYEAGVTNKEYRAKIALNEDNTSATVTYTLKEGVNAVFYAEGEKTEGMTVSTAGNIPARASGAEAGVAKEDVTITTLPVGKYIFHAGIFTSKSSYGENTVNFGIGEQTFSAAFANVNLCEVASAEYELLKSTEIKYLGTSSWGDAQFDYIWIEKTGDYEEADPYAGEHYIYSAADGKFLSRGADWGTRAIADNYGVPANFILSDGAYNIKFIDNEVYLNAGGYTDGAIDGDNTLWIIEGAEGGFLLKNKGNGNYAKMTDGFVNIDGSAENATVWSFKTPEEQAAILAAQQLADHIAIAAAAGKEVATEEAFATLISENYVGQNVTATYLGSDNLNGGNAGDWTVNGVRKLDQDWAAFVGGGNGVTESFSASATLTKELTGLTKGIYKVTMNGFFRQGNNGVCWNMKEAGFLPSTVYLQAGNYATPLKAWGVSATKNGDSYTPDNTTQAATAFNNGDYVNEVYTYVGEDGNLTLSVNIPNFISWAGWACFNNVQLTYYVPKSSSIDVTGIALNKTSASLNTGDVLTLTATITPENATDQSVTWTSSDQTVATVSTAGVVTALNAGTATITATANGGTDVTATCTVTVADAAAPSFYSEIAAGDFYIMNAATGKFLGGDNAWGTQASLIKHGIPFTAALNDGKYTLDSHTYNKDTEHFLTGTYVDGAATNLYITSLGSGKYSISTADGSAFISAKGGTTVVDNTAANANSSLAQWYFISKSDRDKMLAAATAENPVDATYYIPNASFSRNQNTSYNENKWTVTAANSNLAANENCAESYRSSDGFNVTQKITVPNGTYRFRAQGFYRQDGQDNVNKAVFFIGDKEIEFPERTGTENTMALARASFDAGLYYTDWTEVTVTDHTLTLGARTSNTMLWCIWDNFELEMIGYTPVTEIAANIDKTEFEIGQTATISDVTVTPAAASFTGYSFSTSDEAVATVDAKGVVTGVAAGEATITVKAEMENVTKTFDVTIVKPAVVPTEITLNETEIALNATTTTFTLTAVVGPEGANQAVTFASSDETVATVNAEGVVTAVLPGTATITVTSAAKAEITATATVNVTFPESEVPAFTYTNDGATRTVSQLGANLIKNGAFEYPNNFYGWTTGSGAAMSADNFNLITEDDNHYIKAKGHTGAGGANSIGTSWAIEAGKTYVFGYKVKSTSAGNSEFHVVSLTNTLGTETMKVSKTETAVGTDWTDVAYTFTNPATDGYAYVQFRARWLNSAVSFDDFYLCEAVSTTEGNVDYATAAIPTANIGTGAFQYSQDAIDAANNLVQGTATVEDVQNAYDALTTINEPSNGQLFNVILTYNGWTYDQKAMTYLANGRNDAGNYNIQYKEAANKNLAQAFTFTKVSGNNYTMSQIDADGNVRYISTGVPYGGNTSQIRTTTDASKALVVTVIPTATEGKWNLRNTEANQFIGSQDAGVYTVNSHIDFNIVETTKPSIGINTTAAGWGTVMLPFAQELPADVKAYTCEATEGDRLTLTEVDKLEANKPYIVEGSWNANVTGDAQGTALNYTEGLFTGVYADTEAPEGSYVLQNKKEKLGFYRVAKDKQPTVGSNHAYLTVPASVRDAFFFGDGETTAISTLKALSEGTVEIYSLNGVKQSKLQKGTNILKMSDGSIRKVMVK